MAKEFNRALKKGYDVKTIGAVTVNVTEFDPSGNIKEAFGTTVPTAASAGFAKGALFVDTDVATGTSGLYENIGTTTSSNFNVIGAVSPGEITLATNNLLQGSSLGVAEAVTNLTLPKEGSRTVSVAATTTANTIGGSLAIASGAGQGTGAGGATSLTAGASGAGATGNGGAATVFGGAALSTNGLGGNAIVQGGAGVGTGSGGAGGLAGGTAGATGAGGAVSITAAAGGATSGAGGAVTITAGAGTAGNGNGGIITITAGAQHGTGTPGGIYVRSAMFKKQSAAVAKTTSSTMTFVDFSGGIITINQGAGASSAQQLPTAADMDTGFAAFANDDSFDLSFINTSTVDAEDASVTTNTGWTLVGNMDIQAHSSLAAQGSSAVIRLRKTGAAAWTAYRIS